jgi:hypothetical protein
MTDCSAPRHLDDDQPTPAEQDAYLCHACRHQLHRNLTRLPELYDELRSRVATAKSGHGDGSGLPFNDNVSECIRQIRHDLTWWARHITETRRENAPPVAATADDWINHPVKVMAAWLNSQTRWITFRPWAGEIVGAINHDHNTAAALLQPWVVKRITWYATCENCETLRELQATIYDTDHGDRRTSTIECLTCHAAWEFGPEWIRIGKHHHTAA